jgi:hypothetical protein
MRGRALTRSAPLEKSPGHPEVVSYTDRVLERTKLRALPLLDKVPDLVPAGQACCGACRTCMTTNVTGVLAAGVTGAVFYFTRYVLRLPTRRF